MKRICILLAAVLLLCLATNAWAEDGVNVEVIRMDGVSVVVLTPEETMVRARSFAMMAAAPNGTEDAAFTLPQFLTIIEEEAFAGIAAEKVEVSENVVSIGVKAFADCPNLTEITIPANVLSVDDSALAGCSGVTVYGTAGTEAERFAKAAGFTFVDPNAEPETPSVPGDQERPPVELPFVPKK